MSQIITPLTDDKLREIFNSMTKETMVNTLIDRVHEIREITNKK